MRIKSLVKAGQVRIGGATISDPSLRVKPGMAVSVEISAGGGADAGG